MDSELLSRAQSAYREAGLVGLLDRGRRWAQTLGVRALQPDNDGMYVMDEDWDNLVIIDACPLHIFENCYDGPGAVETRISRGETTARFFRENFEGESHYDTIVVSGNAAAGDVAEHLDFFKFVGLWGDADFNQADRRHRDVVPPKAVVEKTIEVHEEHPNKRIISHFLQPHPPFVVKDGEPLSAGSKYRDFTASRRGEISAEKIRKLYRENTDYVLEYVDELTNTLAGKSVITTDHGTLLGEGVPLIYELLHPRWSFRNRNRFDYAHYSNLRLPTLVEVPWVELDSTTRRDVIEAETPEGLEMDRDVIEEQLEALGYRA
jgi:hypothetical protein